jgi:hypothetical protein
MKQTIGLFVALLLCAPGIVFSDVVLDSFDNDRSTENGEGIDGYWNPPPDSTFQVEFEGTKVHAGTGALKVTWENKDIWPSMVFGKLELEGNVGSQFINADAIRMAVAGPAGNMIAKIADTSGFATGDLPHAQASGSDDYEMYEFPYFDIAETSGINMEGITEIWLLIDAGVAGTSGTIYIDSIELILGSGDAAEVVAVVDNFDNDNSIEDEAGVADCAPSGYSFLPGPFTTTVVDDPAGGSNAVLQVDYNTSPWNVLWVDELDVTDWSEAVELSIDVYGTANDILLKLKDNTGAEQEPSGGLQDHVGNQWDTLTWDMTTVNAIDLANMDRLIVFIEGPNGGEGTVYFDNLTLVGVTDVRDWSVY